MHDLPTRVVYKGDVELKNANLFYSDLNFLPVADDR
jgi:hypothetical protein